MSPYPNARLRRVRGLLSSRPLTDTNTTRLDASIFLFFYKKISRFFFLPGLHTTYVHLLAPFVCERDRACV